MQLKTNNEKPSYILIRAIYKNPYFFSFPDFTPYSEFSSLDINIIRYCNTMTSDHTNMDIKKPQPDLKPSSPSNLQVRRARVIRNAYIGTLIGAILAYAIFIVLHITKNLPLPFLGSGSTLYALLAIGGVTFTGFLCPIVLTHDGFNLVWTDLCCRHLSLLSSKEYQVLLEKYMKEHP